MFRFPLCPVRRCYVTGTLFLLLLLRHIFAFCIFIIFNTKLCTDRFFISSFICILYLYHFQTRVFISFQFCVNALISRDLINTSPTGTMREERQRYRDSTTVCHIRLPPTIPSPFTASSSQHDFMRKIADPHARDLTQAAGMLCCWIYVVFPSWVVRVSFIMV